MHHIFIMVRADGISLVLVF